MANYNPHSPEILGNEWVPIRQNALLPDLETEYGYTFQLDHSSVVVSGSIYVDDPVVGYSGQGHQVNLYRAGQEDQTGPIKRVVIPANNGSVTDGAATIIGGGTVTDAVVELDARRYVWFEDPGGAEVDVYFAVNNYSTELTGKRILAVNMLYFASSITIPPDNITTFFGLNMIAPTAATGETEHDITSALTVAPTGGNVAEVQSISLGAASPFPTNSDNEQRRYSWTYQDLQRLEFTATNRICVQFDANGQNSSGGDTVELDYVALEVIYCEENRVAWGGRTAVSEFLAAYDLGPLDSGQHPVQLKTFANMVTGAALTPGDYTVTVGMIDLSPAHNAGPKLTYSGIRQLYEIPTMPGIQITRSLREGDVFEVQPSNIIPTIGLHTRSSVVTGVHAYDSTVGASVYDNVTATQEIDCVGSHAPAVATPYPQVRFYARRFGDTNVPLTLTGLNDPNLASIEISVAEFDALPEIVDGWKEITLRFDVPYPTFSNATTAPDWQWSANNLAAGSRWEILGADNFGTLGTATYGHSSASYGAPFGAAVDFTYDGSLRVAGDATIIFSQDPPAVTGLAVAVETQSLAPVGDDGCGIDLSCVPTALYYHYLSWDSIIPLQVADAFNRTVVTGGWGDSSLGTYQVAPAANAFAFSVVDPDGIIDVDALNTSRRVMFPATFVASDVLMTYEFSVDELPVGGNVELSPMMRIDPAAVGDTYYYPEVEITPNGEIQVRIKLRNAAVETTLTETFTLPNITVVPGEYLRVYAQIRDSVIKLAVRPLDEDFPETWDLVVVSGTLTSGRFGLRAVAETGVSNTLPYTFRVQNLTMYGVWNDIDFNTFGHYELQRQDDDDDDDVWHTIMLGNSPSVTGFADYEARVDVESRYRIRAVNVLDFAGSWSNEQASTLTAPGVVMMTGNANSVLIFTTNDEQDGSSNLAYVQTWENDISEDFTFPEADNVMLRELYGRDNVVAFRPSERGGERFSRTMLVQAAAVPSGRIRDGFRSLRDMAWDDVSYICVRNELGDRWFASVQVPSGKVQRNRRLYLAQVNIIETSNIPCAVELPEE